MMPSKAASAALSLTTALAGIGLYFLAKSGFLWVSALSVMGGIGVGYAALAGGRRQLREHPVRGVWIMTGWMSTLMCIGAGIAGILVWLAIRVADAVSGLSTSEADVVGGAIVTAVTGFAGMLVTRDLDDPDSSIWPGAKTRAAFQKAYVGRFRRDTLQFEAVYEDRVRVNPPFAGWGLKARLQRAKLIAGN